MKANELRLGNYVRTIDTANGGYIISRLVSINENEVCVSGVDTPLTLDKVKPIELDDELLSKCGNMGFN